MKNIIFLAALLLLYGFASFADTNTLTDKATGETITASFFNDIHDALSGTVVPRNSSGIPTTGAGDLGSSTYAWGTLYGAGAQLSGLTASRVVASDGSKNLSSASTTLTQVNYLSSATGTTGTTSTNLVFSTSPTITTPTINTSATITSSSTSGTSLNVTNTDTGGQNYLIRSTGSGDADGAGLLKVYITTASSVVPIKMSTTTVTVPYTTSSTSTSSGALVVGGGLGIGGATYGTTGNMSGKFRFGTDSDPNTSNAQIQTYRSTSTLAALDANYDNFTDWTSSSAYTSGERAVFYAVARRNPGASQTDTNSGGFSGFSTDMRFAAGAGTYTNAQTLGWAGFRFRGFVATSGTGAITHAAGFRVDADSVATGTNKYGLYVGALSGATNNYSIYTGSAQTFLGGSLTIGGNTTGDSNLGTISSVSNSSYYVGSFTAAFVGAFTSTQNKTVNYIKMGRLVMLEIPATSAACSVASTISSGSGDVPSSLRPNSNMAFAANGVFDNGGSDVTARLTINTSGTIVVAANSAGGNFTASGTCGWDRALNVSYFN